MVFNAIVTSYNSATYRYMAKVEGPNGKIIRIYFPKVDDLNDTQNHQAACQELCKRMNLALGRSLALGGPAASWSKLKVSGSLPNGDMVHVFAGDEIEKALRAARHDSIPVGDPKLPPISFIPATVTKS